MKPILPTPNIPKDLRVRRYQFSLALFCEMFKTDNIFNATVEKGWPEDAEIVGLHSDEKAYSFTVIVRSKEFDIVKANEQIPYGEIFLKSREDENGKK